MTPEAELIFISDPEIEYIIPSPSASVAVTVPMAVWFSSTLKELVDVIMGLLSFKLIMLTVIFCVAELASVSVAVTTAV